MQLFQRDIDICTNTTTKLVWQWASLMKAVAITVNKLTSKWHLLNVTELHDGCAPLHHPSIS